MKRVLMGFALLSMFLSITAFECDSKELDSAKLYIKQKNYEKAKEQLEVELSKNPQNDEAYYLFGTILGEEGDISGMVDKFQKSLDVSPKYKAEIDQSRLYYWSKNYNKGAELLQKANGMADGSQKDSTYVAAEDAFRFSTICEPDSAYSQHGLTLALLSTGKLEEATVPAAKYIEITNTPEAYTLLSDVYFAMGYGLMEKFNSSKNVDDSLAAIDKYEKVIELLKKGRVEYPDNTELLQKLSNAYIAADKLEIAKDIFKELVAKEPEIKQYRYNYGVVLLGSNQFPEAIEQFEKAVEIDPDYADAFYNLGLAYARWGNAMRDENEEKQISNDEYKEKYKSALPPFEKYLEINPEDPKIWNLLGEVYTILGDYEKAQEAYDRLEEFK